jgi:hypothetical protein
MRHKQRKGHVTVQWTIGRLTDTRTGTLHVEKSLFQTQRIPSKHFTRAHQAEKKKKLKKKRQDNTKKRNKDCGEIHIHKTKHMSLKHCAIHLLLRYLRKIEMWGDMLAALR